MKSSLSRLVTTKEKGKKVAMYSIHTNPCNSFEFCVGGRDHYVRIYDKRKIVEVSQSLGETVLMMGHKICCYGEIWLVIPKLPPLPILTLNTGKCIKHELL